MDIYLLGSVIKNIAVLGVAAYITAQLPPFRRALNHVQYELIDKLILIVIFGFFSGIGNYLSIPVMGSLAHTRIVGVITGGLLGGPVVGIGAGIIGAIPRYFMGGDVALPAISANVAIGLISGLFSLKHGARNIDIKVALLSAVTAEITLKSMVIMLTPSLEYALRLERAIAAPTIIATCFGVTLFIYIVRDVFKEQEKVQAEGAQHAMRVIRKASGVFRYGLNEVSAKKVAELVYDEIKADAVSVTNKEKILAFIGQGAEHHIVGTSFITKATKLAIKSCKTIIVNDKADIGCPYEKCPLCSVVDAPLVVNQQFYGSIKLYKAGKGVILPYEAELIQGIADFLSLELLHSELEAQNVLLARAEYNSLKAQIHPHFLFNTLGTIRAVIRSNPDKARALITDLSALLRRHLTPGKEVISIEEELECVATYIRLEQVRFGERIKVKYDILPIVLTHPIPIFSIQVLVENSIKHGLAPRKEGGTIMIQSWCDSKKIYIMVEDNGVGISADKLTVLQEMKPDQEIRDGIGIGLKNVHDRLRAIYGKDYGISIQSIKNSGTKVCFSVPFGGGN